MGDASSINPIFLKDLVVVLVVLAGMAGSITAMFKLFKKGGEAREIAPQPLRIIHDRRGVDEERYQRDRAEIMVRIEHIEKVMKEDREALVAEIAAVPHRVIALLKDTKGLL